MEFEGKGFCERCGCSAFLNSFFHEEFHLCMECSMKWIRLAHKNHINNQEDGRNALKQFIKEIWSVS